MPVFHDLKCPACGHVFEHIHEMSDDSPAACPKCSCACLPADRLFVGRGPVVNKRRFHYMQERLIAGDKAGCREV